MNSLAQRRLQSLERQAEESDYIQITFPFVKESIESIQIRNVCHNLNQYLLSLHDFTGSDSPQSDQHQIDIALTDRTAIPDQIFEQLQSPYVSKPVEENEYHAVDIIDKQVNERLHAIQYLKNIISLKLNHHVNLHWDNHIAAQEQLNLDSNEWSVVLKSAKASGELLLSLTRLDELEVIPVLGRKELLTLIQDVSWPSFHRTLAVQLDGRNSGYKLFTNSEMLVGNELITQEHEVDRLVERMNTRHDPESYSIELPEEVLAHLESINEETSIPIDRHGSTKVYLKEDENKKVLIFKLSGAHQDRRHHVYLYECEERCVFMSRVTHDGYVNNLSGDEIVKYTWQRNKNIDLVEFVVSPDGAIMGRVVHPLGSFHWDEFIYCAYTLAVETDTLEYTLSKRDVH